MEREIILQISKELGEKELDELKFLCRDEIPAGTSEKIRDFYNLFQKINQKIGKEDEAIRYVTEMLINIDRKDLSRILGDNLETVSGQVVQPVVDPFIEREECPQILELCEFNNDAQIILVTGGVGIGKTEIVKSVCLEISKRDESIRIIQPMEATEGTKFTAILDDILSNLLNCKSDRIKSKEEHILQILRRLNMNIVLVLDISKVPKDSQFLSNFWRFVNLIVSKNRQVKILITGRYKDSSIPLKKKEVQISYLTRESSRELFDKSGFVEMENIDRGIEYCQGNPLLIVNYQNFANKNRLSQRKESFSLFLERTIHADLAFKAQFETYTTDRKEALVKLAAVPGIISIPLATYILGLDTSDDGKMICEMLTEQQVLSKVCHHYICPPLIQHNIKSIAKEKESLKNIYEKSEYDITIFFRDILYAINSEFMAMTAFKNKDFLKLMLEDQEKLCDCPKTSANNKKRCSCPMSRKLMRLYHYYAASIRWAIEYGIKRSDLWMEIVDCANETVSFLAKTMDLQESEEMYGKLFLSACESHKDKVRIACTQVSLGFLLMYHYGCQTYSDYGCQPYSDNVIDLLEKARPVLSERDDNILLKVEVGEVEAHCVSKLGRSIAAKDPKKQLQGLDYMHRGKAIREDEVKKGRGSKALIAASYVDIANAYYHNEDYTNAEMHFLEALEIQKDILGKHPFTASTLSGLAEIHGKINNCSTSLKFFKLASDMADELCGKHMDTARFKRGLAQVYLDEDSKTTAKRYLNVVYEIGKRFFGKNELCDSTKTLARISEGSEAERLHHEAMEMKELCSAERKNAEKSYQINSKKVYEKNCSFKSLRNFLDQKIVIKMYHIFLLLILAVVFGVLFAVLHQRFLLL